MDVAFLASLIRVHDKGSRLVPGTGIESTWACAYFFIFGPDPYGLGLCVLRALKTVRRHISWEA